MSGVCHLYHALPGGPVFHPLCGADQRDSEMPDPNNAHEHCEECGEIRAANGDPQMACPGESCDYVTPEPQAGS